MQSVNSFGAWMGPLGPWALVRRTVCTPVMPPLQAIINHSLCSKREIGYFFKQSTKLNNYINWLIVTKVLIIEQLKDRYLKRLKSIIMKNKILLSSCHFPYTIHWKRKYEMLPWCFKITFIFIILCGLFKISINQIFLSLIYRPSYVIKQELSPDKLYKYPDILPQTLLLPI